MELNEITKTFARHPKIAAVARLLDDAEMRTIHCGGLCASAAPVVFATLVKEKNCRQPFLFVMNDEEEAGYFYNDLTKLVDEERVLLFPSSFKRAVKFAQRDDANEILRTDVLTRLTDANTDGLLLVTYPEALAERVVSSRQLTAQTLRLHTGQHTAPTEVEQTLFSLGFVRTDYVYAPGEFAVRGSIIDVFSFASEYPFRIDFFGDEIDSIRTFEVQSQLSQKRCDAATIVPAVADDAEERTDFATCLPPRTLTVFRDYLFVRDRIEQIYAEGFTPQAHADYYSRRADERQALPPLEASRLLTTGKAFGQDFLAFRRIDIGLRPTGVPQAAVTFATHQQPLYHKQFDTAANSLSQFQKEGHTIYIGADSEKQNERLRSIFEEMNRAIVFTPMRHTLHEGFVDDDVKACVFTDHQIFDRFHKYNLRTAHARNAKVALTLKELQQFEVGDYIVHVDHGIGQFAGLVKIPSGSDYQEVIKITFQKGDAVFVSIHALHKISKYKGKEGQPPKVSTLGTGAWEKLKDRTKKKLKDIARDLISLYARRREEQGFAFTRDTFMQHELEASFKYEDTPDQLKVTQDVKADMESQRPMDRLVCGDVGFGKTEIAVRAAFKAASDNKQVAILVPTTILAFQHYNTFRDRLANFPVTVEYLSRARKPKETKAVLDGLARGTINIVVGTHKLIGAQVKFKDLGLLIIDEEHKFGVSVKEKLKQLKVNIDTLTMSATPIPRTLQFSLMGARDLSVINTPPPNRHPIDTQIVQFSGEVIADAVNFELSRNGQVFVVSNRIAALPHLAALISRHVPDARVAIAHGQMSPEKMEGIITDFIQHDFDVLISTTIIENGIDIPNANTIIVDAAHHFGLSDLHQMRGRVGRSNRKAFCYLLAPPLSVLPADARRRLQAIENFSDLGSGIHIAMQDLDIRGAGNLLGAEQSGFVADLGYETYQKILREAVTELRNEEFSELFAEEAARQNALTGEYFVDECTLESDLHIYLPETYVPGNSERMLLYRELDGMMTDEETTDFRSRLEDRFGALPKEAEDLLSVVALRRLGRRVGAERIFLKAGRMTLQLVGNRESAYYRSNTFDRLISYATTNYKRCALSDNAGKARITIAAVPDVQTAISVLTAMTAE